MWPAYAAGMLAVAALAVGMVLGVAGARHAAVACALAVGVFAVVGVAMYGATEARYQACVDGDKGIAEDSDFAVSGNHWCSRRVFGGVRGEMIP